MSKMESTSSGPQKATSRTVLRQSNMNQVPRANRSTVDRFIRTPASEAPYYLGARAAEGPRHLDGLSSQLNAMDEILRPRN